MRSARRKQAAKRDPKQEDAAKLQPWKCECGAVLGAVRKTSEDTVAPVKVRRLVVFTPATRNLDPAVIEVRTENSLVELRGDGWVKCPFCGRKRRWALEAEAMQEMIAKRAARR